MRVSLVSHMYFPAMHDCILFMSDAIDLQIQRLEKLLSDSQVGITSVTSHAESLKNATDKLSKELDRVQRQLTVVTGQYTSLQVCHYVVTYSLCNKSVFLSVP
jgi:hypothetical protein